MIDNHYNWYNYFDGFDEYLLSEINRGTLSKILAIYHIGFSTPNFLIIP